MDRVTVQYGQIPLETDLLQAEQFSMIGIGKLIEAAIGTGPVIDGFTVSPSSPSGMSVVVGAGQIFQQENLESTAWSSLPVDTHTIVKQGLVIDPTTLTIAAPTTVGYAQSYLVQAAYLESDTGAVVRPYYNPSNPAVNFNGPGNAGTRDNTVRKGGVAIVAKAGIAAASGSQTVPAPDSGYVGVAVVTVAYGATAISSGNITQYPGAPFLAAKLGQLPSYIQNDTAVYCVDQGATNSVAVTPVPAFQTYAPGQRLKVKMAHAPTGAVTINVSGLGALPIVRQGGVALVGAEWTINDIVELNCRGSDWQILRLTSNDVATVSVIHIGTDTSGSAATITAAVSPAITSYALDHIYVIKVANACAGATVANLNAVGTRSVKRCDGSSLEATDWAAGDVLLLGDDGTNLRLVGLTKLQAGELASASTSVTNIIAKNSDAGLTSLTAFTANNVGVSDVAQVPNFTLIQSTGFFHGATAIRVNGSGAIRNNTSANGTAGATLRWGLYDASTSSVVAYAPYLGGGVPITGAQVAYTVPEHVFQGLNTAHSYCIQMLAQKGTSDGAELAFDTSIDALHNGVNS